MRRVDCFDLLILVPSGLSFIPIIRERAAQEHSTAINSLALHLRNIEPGTEQSIEWFRQFPEYRQWLATPGLLCFIEPEATNKTNLISILLGHGVLPEPTFQNIIYVDMSRFENLAATDAQTYALHSLLYQTIHLRPGSLDKLFGFFKAIKSPVGKGLSRLFEDCQRVDADHGFMVDALSWLTIEVSSQTSHRVYSILDNIDRLRPEARVSLLGYLRSKFGETESDRMMFCTSPEPDVSEYLFGLPTISTETETHCKSQRTS